MKHSGKTKSRIFFRKSDFFFNQIFPPKKPICFIENPIFFLKNPIFFYRKSKFFPENTKFGALSLYAYYYSGVARGGAGGANAPPQIFVVPLLPKTPTGNKVYIMHIITEYS